MRPLKSGGGWRAILYTLKKGREVGFLNLWRAMRSKNACKTCAVGMGGQQGGMTNERGSFPEFCKKSLQAMASDMQGGIREEFWRTYAIEQLRAFTPRELEMCGRLTQPVIYDRAVDYFRVVTWEEALTRVIRKLRTTPADETFWYFSGRASNEAGFLLQLFARLYGTNNVNNCSYYCHQASGVGLSSSVGTGTATISLEDVEHSDLVFVIGGNPPSNHPRLMTTLAEVRGRGGDVIVINPVVELGLQNFRVPSVMRSLFFGTNIASQYVQPHIGGDLALLTGVAKRIDEMGATDAAFLREHCEGWPELQAGLQAASWHEIVAKSGVARDEIEKIAQRYAAAKRVVFSWTMGITHHANGVENVQAIANLALMRGMVGRPGAGLMPIRGHSNVQGIGSMGVTPKLKEAIFEAIQTHFGVQLPTTPGLDTMGCMDQAVEGKLKVGFCLGGNLFGSNPDASYAAKAIGNLDQICYLNTTLNTGHPHGLARETIILPVLARDEESQATTQESMFNFVRLSDGGPARIEGPKSEVEIIGRIAAGVLGTGGPVDWESMLDHRQIRQAVAKIVPGFEELGEIDRTKREFHINGRLLHEPKFPRASGRAKLHTHAMPPLAGSAGELRMMTVRSEGQFNTVVYEEEDLYRGQDRRDVILMHPDDITSRGLSDGTPVTVRSATGAMPGILVKAFDRIKPGNALMYYPEANVLVSRALDPQSRTPAFKSVLVTIEVSARTLPRTTDREPIAIGNGSTTRDSMKAC